MKLFKTLFMNLKYLFKIVVIILILSSCENNANTQKLDYIEIVPTNTKSLVIILHGYGNDNNNMLSLATDLSKSFPDTAFILPNAPFKVRGVYSKSYQWFPLNQPEFIMRKEAKRTNKILNNFIKEQSKRFSLDNENIIISGFSQGGIMSLYNGLRQKKAFAGIISFSGLLPDNFESLKKDLRSKPNILLIHGTSDDTVLYSNLAEAEEILTKLKIPYKSYTMIGVGHRIDHNAILQAEDFIKTNIKNKE